MNTTTETIRLPDNVIHFTQARLIRVAGSDDLATLTFQPGARVPDNTFREIVFVAPDAIWRLAVKRRLPPGHRRSRYTGRTSLESRILVEITEVQRKDEAVKS